MDRIEVRLLVDWREQLKMLKLRFPINVKSMKATREIPYGTIECTESGEKNLSKAGGCIWHLGGHRIPTFQLLNDGKYSLDGMGLISA